MVAFRALSRREVSALLRIARDLSCWRTAEARDRALDDGCVLLLEATSPPTVLARVRHEERIGISPYTDGVQRLRMDPRAYLAECATCGRAFWAFHHFARCCSDRCRARRWWHERGGWPAMVARAADRERRRAAGEEIRRGRRRRAAA